MAFCTLEPGIPPCAVLWSHAFLSRVIASLYLVLDRAQWSVAASAMGRTSLGPGDSASFLFAIGVVRMSSGQIGVSISSLELKPHATFSMLFYSSSLQPDRTSHL